MSIIFAAVAALALIALGIAVVKYRALKLKYGWLHEDYYLEQKATKKLKLQKAALEKEINVLRTSNRDSLKVWQSERQRLWTQARDAERHGQELQEFHLHNEFSLQHELAGAHALIELLMATFPKDYAITPVPYEVQRIFAPVIEMDQHRPASTKHNNPHVF